MSIRVITIVWDRFPAGSSELLALLALADWADDRGRRLYPSVAALAAKIRMSERQTKRILEKLIEGGYLELVTPGNQGGRRKSNRYRIRLETLSNCPIVSRETMTSCPENPDKLSINPDTAMSDEPLEPIEPLPPPAGSLAARIRDQRIFLKQLETAGADPGEIDTHRQRLEQLERERDGGQEALPI